jgi:hypothetical protein
VRKATLASLLRRAAPGLRFNEHLENEDGPRTDDQDRRHGVDTPGHNAGNSRLG